MSSSSITSPQRRMLLAVMSLGMALAADSASAHVAMVRNSSRLRGNDSAVVNRRSVNGSPVHVKTTKGVGVTTRTYGNKTIVTFDRPVFAAGAYLQGTGNQPAMASVQAYDKGGRQIKLYDEGTRRLRVTQHTVARPNGGRLTTFMGARSCCACIKQLVYTTPKMQLAKVNVATRPVTPPTPRPLVATRLAPETTYRPVVASRTPAIIPPPRSAVAVAAPVAGGGGGFPWAALAIPALFLNGGGGETYYNNVNPPIPSLPPDTPPIPEPSAIMLALPGLLPLIALRRRRSKKNDELE